MNDEQPTEAMPREIWESTLEEGERRLKRAPGGLAATGLVGGLDVMLGLVAVVVVSGAALSVMEPELAHIVGSLAFGIALVFVTVGRSELFTENFMVPVGAVFSGRGRRQDLIQMWAITLLFNLIGLAALSAIIAIDGVLPASAHEAAGDLATTFEERSLPAMIGSALLAGFVMTTFTWVTVASSSDGARIALALLTGFLLLAPTLNHAVVSFGEVVLALFAGTSKIGALDLAGRELVAIAGNLVGGLAFVTATRFVQVGGEPEAD